MSQVENTPEVVPQKNLESQRIAKAQVIAKTFGTKAVTFVKNNPIRSGLAALVCAIGLYGAFGGSSKVPLAQANVPSAQASKTRATGQTKTIKMVVGSFRKTENLLILNNHRDYKQATMNVVVDLKAAPELATYNFRSLVGQEVEAKGEYQEYDGKPQVKVTRADHLTIDPQKQPEKK